jgi:hypothetical protein
MSDVFISYAREDRQLAQALASDLAARGFAVWWDAALLGSDDYQDVILEALGKAKAAIVIWTKHSAKSRFVRDEARFALHLEKLVAVKTAELDVFSIPFGFQGQHTENVTDREQIVRAITKLGARAAAGTRQVAPASLPAASRIDWDVLKTSGTAEQVLSFLETGPSEVQRREATARLRQLMAAPQDRDNVRNSVVRSLSMSNWEAFFRGLTFRLPSFQLTTQGTWASIGMAIGNALLLLLLLMLSMILLGSIVNTERKWLLSLPALAFVLLAAFSWTRFARLVEQRNFAGSYVLAVMFVLVATLSGFVCYGALKDNKLIDVSHSIPAILAFIVPFISIAAVVWRIRAAR